MSNIFSLSQFSTVPYSYLVFKFQRMPSSNFFFCSTDLKWFIDYLYISFSLHFSPSVHVSPSLCPSFSPSFLSVLIYPPNSECIVSHKNRQRIDTERSVQSICQNQSYLSLFPFPPFLQQFTTKSKTLRPQAFNLLRVQCAP